MSKRRFTKFRYHGGWVVVPSETSLATFKRLFVSPGSRASWSQTLGAIEVSKAQWRAASAVTGGRL